jgi:hypothetical protein
LVLGDGDGRFLARLLAQNPALTADAVDSSPAMLRLLCDRCAAQAPSSKSRLQTHQSDVIDFLAVNSATQYDLVVTHFFLDCFSQSEVDSLASGIATRMTPDALWLVSDFRVPTGAMRLPARAYVRILYFAFRVITGLRVTQLPDHVSALTGSGLYRVGCERTLAGMLTTELWSKIS